MLKKLMAMLPEVAGPTKKKLSFNIGCAIISIGNTTQCIPHTTDNVAPTRSMFIDLILCSI